MIKIKALVFVFVGILAPALPVHSALTEYQWNSCDWIVTGMSSAELLYEMQKAEQDWQLAQGQLREQVNLATGIDLRRLAEASMKIEAAVELMYTPPNQRGGQNFHHGLTRSEYKMELYRDISRALGDKKVDVIKILRRFLEAQRQGWFSERVLVELLELNEEMVEQANEVDNLFLTYSALKALWQVSGPGSEASS